MMNKIVFDGIEIEVINCIPQKNENGKDVLKITILGDVPFDRVKLLKGYSGIIQYFENDILKTEYCNYSADFTNNYKLDTHNVELTRIDATQQAIEVLQEKIETTWSAVDFILTEGL